MPVETEKENVCINQIIGQKRAETLVEGDVIVNDVKPDVLNIISANGIACVYKKEVMDGKIRIDGDLVLKNGIVTGYNVCKRVKKVVNPSCIRATV